MANRTKLTDVEKAYIEKYKNDKSADVMAQEINIKGVGVKTVEKYLNELVDVGTQTTIKKEDSGKFDISDLAGKHERGGVVTMTEGLSELLDDLSKKTDIIDYRGKMAKIRADKPGPKGIRIDD